MELQNSGDCTGDQDPTSVSEIVPADGHRGCQLEDAENSPRRHFDGSPSNKSACLIDIAGFVKDFRAVRPPERQSECSLNSSFSATFPARLASVMDSKKSFECSIGLLLPAR